ncbi:GNAT family N-acetyltransferase [Bdellovibrionota bacterium]
MIKSFTTDKLTITPSLREESEELDSIRVSVKYISAWMSKEANEMDGNIKDGFLTGWDVPLGRSSDDYQMLTVRLNRENKIIGYLGLFHKYPEEHGIWISILAIHPDFQKCGYGYNVVEALLRHLTKESRYKYVSLSIDLKNWPALCFWLKAGFTEYVKYVGDKDYSKESFPKLVLKHSIKRWNREQT